MQWSGDIYFLVFLFLPTIENAVVNIDGSIDLGPYFQIEYSLAPLSYNIDTAKHVRELSKPSRRPAHKKRQRKKKRSHKYLRDEEITTQTVPSDEETVTSSTVLMTMLDEENTPEMSVPGSPLTETPDTEPTEIETSEPEITALDTPGAELETEATGIDTPETEATGTDTPETEATGADTPETEATGADTPETEATEADTPETEATEADTPETEATGAHTPETESTGTETPEIEAMGTGNPESKTTEDILQTESTRFAGSTLVSTSASKRPEKITTEPEWISKWFTRSTKPRTTRLFDVTQNFPINGAINSKIFDESHKVKDVVIIKDFSVHVMRQTLQVFEAIKNKIDDHKTKRKVDLLSRNYKEKFSDFVRETQKHNIRTRLGTQKVILNIIDTSNRILRRLVNYFVGTINKNPKLNDEGIGNVVEKEVRKEIELEYHHACTKFGICRNAAGFQQFLLDVLNELLKNDDNNLRQANDAFTEVIKETDLSKILDSELQKKVNKAVLRLELMETKFLKPTYAIWRNAIALRNKPIVVMPGADSSTVNKTVAFLDIIDTLDLNIKPNEKNVLIWNEIKHRLSQWTARIVKDSYPIMKMLIQHIMFEVSKFDLGTVTNINEKLRIITMDVERMAYDYG